MDPGSFSMQKNRVYNSWIARWNPLKPVLFSSTIKCLEILLGMANAISLTSFFLLQKRIAKIEPLSYDAFLKGKKYKNYS